MLKLLLPLVVAAAAAAATAVFLFRNNNAATHRRRRRRRFLMEPPTEEKTITTVGTRGDGGHDAAVPCKCSLQQMKEACCKRYLGKAHKMGFELSRALLANENRIKETQFFNRDLPPKQTKDYRVVVLTRNFYESLVSGYLYHKTGRECWVGPYGEPIDENYHSFPVDWETRCDVKLDHPSKGRDICSYLSNETEPVGMRAYMQTAWGRYYQQLVQFYNSSVKDKQHRTMHICFEDLSNETLQPSLIKKLYNHWLLPEPPANETRRLFLWHNERRLDYQGGHATNHDPKLRAQLRDIVAQIDSSEDFDYQYLRLDKQFGCGMTA